MVFTARSVLYEYDHLFVLVFLPAEFVGVGSRSAGSVDTETLSIRSCSIG